MYTSIQADGGILPCGQFMKSAQFRGLGSFEEVYHGPIMQDIRDKMLKDEHVEGCQCPAEEAVGIQSMRQTSIIKFGMPTKPQLRAVELVFDNVCNLKCRGCASPHSHLWYEDEIKIYGKTLLDLKYNKSSAYKDMYLGNLEEIFILGGEPLLSPNAELFAKRLKEEDVIKNLSVKISTNGTILPTGAMLDLFTECKYLHLNISIDGYTELNDYFRSGSEFNQIVKNMEWYNALLNKRPADSTYINVHTTVSIYNANVLQRLDDFVRPFFPKFYSSQQMMQYPIWMNIKNTPESYKVQMREILKDRPEYKNVLDFLNLPGEDLFGHFINFHDQLDEIRQEKLNEGNPYLVSYINSERKNYSISREESKKFFVDYYDNLFKN